ncbi:hypothetical protein Lal_00007275 [Lupinus albus]|uniref:Putative transcription factor C2H2 family n=1 Tax=Lupinus albus TaxID=3870 RepID=A0A6A5MIA0_LUPAL|nr:putative transcription factor C2H2 family [Lupinus albus]KAF1874661.1 hypothetical protein Lal_00007275 [Lupinus albus]
MSNTHFVENFKDRKFKPKIMESSIIEKDLELSLSLSLSGNYTIHKPSSKPTFKSLKASNNSSCFDPKFIESSDDNEIVKEKQFSCKFCEKKFHNPQALGGHQNTHRRERILSRINKEFSMSTFGLGVHPYLYSSIGNCNLQGSPLNHMGHMHPMAHMSRMPSHNFELGYGNKGFYNTSFSNNHFGMRSNSWGISHETPQRLNHMDVGFSCEYDQVPSRAGNVVNRSNTIHGDH